MATRQFSQQFSVEDSSPDEVNSCQSQDSVNPLLEIEEYLRLVDPRAEVSLEKDLYQNQHDHVEGYQSHGSPAWPDEAASDSHGHYPSVPNQADYASVSPESTLLHNEEDDTDDGPVQPTSRRLRKCKPREAYHAATEDDQPRSKRAERRAKIVEEHGAVGATDVPKGKIREQDGIIEWYDPDRRIWRPAAPLDDYRQEIIHEDSALGSYDYPPDHGQHVDDITTFPPGDDLGQSHWNFHDRNSWGEIMDAEGNEVMYLIDRPATEIEPPNPGFMEYNGMIMLDPDDHPIIDWPGIPRCFSSQIEGARIEALRRVYPWLGLPHFRARMPRQVRRKQVGVKPLFGLSSLTQRLSRFRETYDIPPWKKTHVNKGSDLIRYTKARLAEEGFEPNSTAGLQPLSRNEILRRKQAAKGQFPENKGVYTLTEEQRREKAEREARRRAEKEEREQEENAADLTNGSLSGLMMKRKRDDSTSPGMYDEPTSKRYCQPLGSPIKRSQQSTPTLTSGVNAVLPYRTMSPKHFLNQQIRAPNTLPNYPLFNRVQQLTLNQPEAHSAPTTPFPCRPPTDFRLLPPLTLTDQLAIKTALSYTMLDYQYFHSCAPPVTTNTASYLMQYQEIQAHHQQNWLVAGQIPQLVGLEAWLGGFEKVPVPKIGEHVARRLLDAVKQYDMQLTDFNVLGGLESPRTVIGNFSVNDEARPSTAPNGFMSNSANNSSSSSQNFHNWNGVWGSL